MVVLSASVLGKNGKVLVSRQYVEMSRIRIEGLLAAFPKLIGSNSQHTFIDTESVRYVYQPMEQFFLLLITNKASNIVEDLETLRLLSKVVPDVTGGLSEELIQDKAYQLVFAFDEAINAGGYAENITLQQIRTNLEMESHEEKLQMMIRQSKEDTAKEEMRRKAQAIREEHREREKLAKAAGLRPNDPYAAQLGGGGSTPFGNSSTSISSSTFSPATTPTPLPVETTPQRSTSSKGMQLGKSKKATDFVSAMAAEDNLSEPPPAAATPNQPAPPPAPVLSNDPVSMAVEEKILVTLNREGALQNMELKGTLSLLVNDPTVEKSRVYLKMGDNSGLVIQTHPMLDKALYEKEQVLGLKDARKGFPNRKVGVLKWSLKTSDESFVPLSINCWPEEEGSGAYNVNIEYSLERSDLVLKNVDILIPLGAGSSPEILSIDGVHMVNPRDGTLVWHLDQIDDSSSTGALEFNVRTSNPSAFFPVQVSFISQTPYCQLDVMRVTEVEKGQEVKYGISKLLAPEQYVVA